MHTREYLSSLMNDQQSRLDKSWRCSQFTLNSTLMIILWNCNIVGYPVNWSVCSLYLNCATSAVMPQVYKEKFWSDIHYCAWGILHLDTFWEVSLAYLCQHLNTYNCVLESIPVIKFVHLILFKVKDPLCTESFVATNLLVLFNCANTLDSVHMK